LLLLPFLLDRMFDIPKMINIKVVSRLLLLLLDLPHTTEFVCVGLFDNILKGIFDYVPKWNSPLRA
jgi:hypothetical protein